MAVKDYKTNPDENTTISGINIAEGCPPSGINNAIRQLMADVKQNADQQDSAIMTGATSSASGTAGLVPAPESSAQNRPLRGDGTWAESLDCEVSRLKGSYISEVEDTIEWWKAKGNSVWYVSGKKFDTQPADYGMILNTFVGSNIQQLFLSAPTGDVFKRGGNSHGWNGNANDPGNWSSVTNSMPVGAIYVQFSGQSAPADLFGGTWSNVSSSYAGRFFRAEGGSAANFGSTQDGGLPNVSAEIIDLHTGTQPKAYGAFSFTKSGTFPGGNLTANYQFGSLKLRANSTNSLYGSADEVRPINATIRIWKRTA